MISCIEHGVSKAFAEHPEPVDGGIPLHKVPDVFSIHYCMQYGNPHLLRSFVTVPSYPVHLPNAETADSESGYWTDCETSRTRSASECAWEYRN